MKELYMINLQPIEGYEFSEDDIKIIEDLHSNDIHKTYENCLEYGKKCLDACENVQYFTINKEFYRENNELVEWVYAS